MRCAIGVLIATLTLLAQTARGNPAADAAKGSPPAATLAETRDAKDKDSLSAQGGDKWRFRQHQGSWWYWLPTNQWVYWTGKKWVAYDPASYSEFYQARHPSQQSGPTNSALGGGSGNWGPVRYNQYGQRQYPYSQRRSGLQQLGPVPAMGGVRSLPGWGGER